MDIFLNYFKLYIKNDCKPILRNDLIPYTKYLIKYTNDANDIIYYIGITHIHFSDIDSDYLWCCHDHGIIFLSIHNDMCYYELVDDFSLNHCDDLIQTHYLVNDYNPNITNKNKYIYTIKHNYLIRISNNIFPKSGLIVNNIWNPFYNSSYELQISLNNTQD